MFPGNGDRRLPATSLNRRSWPKRHPIGQADACRGLSHPRTTVGHRLPCSRRS